jgi:hypothetical protein
MVAWLIRNHPELYMRRKSLGTHTGDHRLKDEVEFLSMHAKLIEMGEGITGVRERYNLWMLARAVGHLPGAIAEVGVFRGGSAMLLAAAKGTAPLHLFDTFEGMPETDPRHDGVFTAGMFGDTGLDAVRARLAPWSNVEFHPGFFPDSASDMDPSLQFKLTNIDVDIRSATLACLEFFYPRTVQGGFLVVHDYNDCGVPGAKAAVDEFMRGKREVVLELWDTQALIVKL